MAYFTNSCTQTRIRKGVQIKWWLVYVIYILLFSSPYIISADCLGVNKTVTIVPDNDIILRYGEPLEMFCISENMSNTAEDLDFYLFNKPLGSEFVNSTTRKLYFKKPEKQSNTYYCANKNSRKHFCLKRVTVESSPSNVTDFKCFSKNLEILNCSWTDPEIYYLKVNYSLTFEVNEQEVEPINAVKASDTWYCNWTLTSTPMYRQQVEIYKFYLKACNSMGCNIQTFTVDHAAVVKSNPPKIENIICSQHSVMLNWSIPNNMIDLLIGGVDHKIEYQIGKIDNITQFRPVKDFKLTRNKYNFIYVLNLPYAHMQYEVRIYVKPKKAEDAFWSDYDYKAFTTLSEKPKRPPTIIAGMFHQAIYTNYRLIYVYWRQLEEYEEAGANFTYKVIITQNNKTDTKFVDKNKSLSFVELNSASLEAIFVTVYSYNENGSSINSSHLYIPPATKTPSLSLASFTQIANNDGSYELSWDGFENINNYSIFWCEHTIINVCIGRMNYTIVDAHTTNYTVFLPKNNRYQFAISANNGTASSGMVWAACDIAKEGLAFHNFPVHLDHDPPGKSYVMLRWKLGCSLKKKIITGYKITYCPVVQTSVICDPIVGNKSVYISNSIEQSTNVTGLLPFRTYQFSIALNTTSGMKTVGNTTHSATTLEDTPSSPRDVKITNVTYNSLTITWLPPQNRNGNIREYVRYRQYQHENQTKELPITFENRRRVMNISDLLPFTNYSFAVQACNIASNDCSKLRVGDYINLRTAIGPPSKLDPPSIQENPDRIEWRPPPAYAGGTLDMYQILKTVDNVETELINASGPVYLTKHCDGEVKELTYQVRALNFNEDKYNGVLTSNINVELPKNSAMVTYYGEWSENGNMRCAYGSRLTMVFIIMGIFGLIVMGYVTYRAYQKYRKIQDIKPVLPVGLGIPEKDVSKYAFVNKDEKPSSDEMLLLPNKTDIPPSGIKKKDSENCGVSDQTNSTILSETLRDDVKKQNCSSDDGSSSSMQLETETVKIDGNPEIKEVEEDSLGSETDSSPESSPCFNNKQFKKNPNSGYVQPVMNPKMPPFKNTPLKNVQTGDSSYVMAGLSPPIFTTTSQPIARNCFSSPSTGYVRPEVVQAKSTIFPNLGASTTSYGPETLPKTTTLPISTKCEADSSYIQLQPLDTIPSIKSSHINVPLKPRISNGYVSSGDPVISKHLNNMLTATQIPEESAILDPAMSPDAYCRFSWSTDPANDNLHTLLSDSPVVDTSQK